MKTRKLWALPGVLLALCLVLALPAAAEEAGKTAQLTYEYPEDLCTFTARSIDGQPYPYGSAVPLPPGGGCTGVIFEIGDIAGGYRIKSVLLNETRGRTYLFAGGVYGSASTGVCGDTHMQVELEKIPDSLPSVTGVKLYTDEACTQEAPAYIDYTAESGEDRLYGKGTYSDGGDYPSYYAAGQWEYSTDGVNWKPTRRWGSNRWDFWPGWQNHTELDFLNGSYDMRLRVTSNGRYTGGEDAISNAVHVNGGAVNSGAGAAVTRVTLDQTELTLTVSGGGRPLKATVEPESAAGEPVTWTSSNVNVASVSNGLVVPVGPGEAVITAEAGGKTASCAVTVQKADLDRRNFVIRQDGQLVDDRSTGVLQLAYREGGYTFSVAYAAEDDSGRTATNEEEAGKLTFYMERVNEADGSRTRIDGDTITEAGEYHLRITAAGGSRYEKLESTDKLSDYFTVIVKASGGGPAGQPEISHVEVQDGRVTFSVALPAGTDGVLLAAGWLGGRLSDTAAGGGSVSLPGETAMVFFLEKGTFIPLAKAIRVTG